MNDDTRALAALINDQGADPLESLKLRRAIVTAVNRVANTYTVLLGGATVPNMPAAQHLYAEVGDAVDVLINGAAPTIIGKSGPMLWHYVGAVGEPGFLNGWTNLSGIPSALNTGAGDGPVRYAKDALGFVHLEGMIAGGTVGAEGFILPAGFRPEQRTNLPALTNNAFGFVVIVGKYNTDTPGRVILQSGSNAYFALSGMTFYAG